MGKRVDFSAAIFHEASGCVAAAGVSWFTLSKETSPLIVLIHHLTTGTHGDHKTSIAFFSPLLSPATGGAYTNPSSHA